MVASGCWRWLLVVGGNGATGGAGGVSGDGGGGGSGYTDDTFDIINAELGGNTTTSSSVTFQVVT